MKEIIDKFKSVIKELESEQGPLFIFALFLREEPLEKWDILVSAKWLDSKKIEDYRLIVSKIKSKLDDLELMKFSRVVILDYKDPVVSFLQDSHVIINGSYEELVAQDLSQRFGFTIKQAYLLRSRKIEN